MQVMLRQSQILAGLAVAISGALMLPLKPIVAAPLTNAECAQLKDEQLKLGALGIRAAMLRGPDWAKANADPAMLKNIARLIEVEEGISFRCPLPKPVADTKADDSAAAPAAKKSAPKAAAKSDSDDVPAKAAPKAPPKAQSKSSESKSTQPKAATPKAAQPKPKVNDAYVPPPKAPAWNAAQPANSKQQ